MRLVAGGISFVLGETGMIKRDDLIDVFERMQRENWAYEWGAAREGCVDCSGAFVYAYDQLGGPSITHGSNSILRQSMGALLPMSAAQPGYAAVKVRAWSEVEKSNRWYNQKPGDCYHIGLVGRYGKILNAQGTATGFVESDPGTWTGCAPLLDVDYWKEGESVLYQAIVATEKDPLRIRQSAVDGKVIGSAPRGETVEVLADSGDGWPRIRYGGIVGYVSGAYLTRVVDESDNTDGDSQQDTGDTGDPVTYTTLIRDDGTALMLVGSWHVAND